VDLCQNIFVEIDTTNGDPEFVRCIERILRSIDFSDDSFGNDAIRQFYAAVATDGFEAVARGIWHSLRGSAKAQAQIENLTHHLGNLVIARLTEEERVRFLPYNDVVIFPRDRCIRVEFSSVHKQTDGSERTFYYSRRRPTVRIQGQVRVVAFTEHAVERICKRVAPNWETYAGLGTAHSYLADCVYFEPTHVRPDGPHASDRFDQPAVGLFGDCHLQSFHPQILNRQQEWFHVAFPDLPMCPATFAKPWFFRVGYCPVKMFGEFCVAQTLLLPGFRKTPEYALLEMSSLPEEKKRRLRAAAAEDEMADPFDVWDRDLLRWFHRNGVPQILQFDHPVIVGEPTGGLLDSPYCRAHGSRSLMEKLAGQES
jgi:hypothetical protein